MLSALTVRVSAAVCAVAVGVACGACAHGNRVTWSNIDGWLR